MSAAALRTPSQFTAANAADLAVEHPEPGVSHAGGRGSGSTQDSPSRSDVAEAGGMTDIRSGRSCLPSEATRTRVVGDARITTAADLRNDTHLCGTRYRIFDGQLIESIPVVKRARRRRRNGVLVAVHVTWDDNTHCTYRPDVVLIPLGAVA